MWELRGCDVTLDRSTPAWERLYVVLVALCVQELSMIESETAGQYTLYYPPVESGKDGERGFISSSFSGSEDTAGSGFS